MNTVAVLIMLLAMVMIWGGLVLSIIHLMKNPDISLDDVK